MELVKKAWIKSKSKFSKTKFKKIFEYMKKKSKITEKLIGIGLEFFYVYGFFKNPSLIPYLLKNIKNKKKLF